jgi:hypothetical protein
LTSIPCFSLFGSTKWSLINIGYTRCSNTTTNYWLLRPELAVLVLIRTWVRLHSVSIYPSFGTSNTIYLLNCNPQPMSM